MLGEGHINEVLSLNSLTDASPVSHSNVHHPDRAAICSVRRSITHSKYCNVHLVGKKEINHTVINMEVTEPCAGLLGSEDDALCRGLGFWRLPVTILKTSISRTINTKYCN